MNFISLLSFLKGFTNSVFHFPYVQINGAMVSLTQLIVHAIGEDKETNNFHDIFSYLDTSWFLANVDSVDTKIKKVKNGAYEANSVNIVDKCLSKGDYNFTVYDEYGEIVSNTLPFYYCVSDVMMNLIIVLYQR